MTIPLVPDGVKRSRGDAGGFTLHNSCQVPFLHAWHTFNSTLEIELPLHGFMVQIRSEDDILIKVCIYSLPQGRPAFRSLTSLWWITVPKSVFGHTVILVVVDSFVNIVTCCDDILVCRLRASVSVWRIGQCWFSHYSHKMRMSSEFEIWLNIRSDNPLIQCCPVYSTDLGCLGFYCLRSRKVMPVAIELDNWSQVVNRKILWRRHPPVAAALLLLGVLARM